jgi:hypothetical protein
MNATQILQYAALTWMLLWSCAANVSAVDLPAPVSFNSSAGRGDGLFVTVRCRDKDALLFGIDTGMPVTVLDRSLEGILGKCVYTNVTRYEWFSSTETHVYQAANLFLGQTRLTTGKWVRTDDLRRFQAGSPSRGRQLSGVLGMDCLQNYCVQLDFDTGKVRFFDPERLKTNSLGKAFPLTFVQGGRWRVAGTLVGTEGNSWIDTGDPNDGCLITNLFADMVRAHEGITVHHFNTPSGNPMTAVKITEGSFGGFTYTNLNIGENPTENIIGLRFLARNLVTFNFPKSVMYLKQNRIGPLEQEK